MVKVSVVSCLINVILESDCTVRYSTICGLLCQIFIYYLNSPSYIAGLKVRKGLKVNRGLKGKDGAKMHRAEQVLSLSLHFQLEGAKLCIIERQILIKKAKLTSNEHS
jgi:hypothetical protein